MTQFIEAHVLKASPLAERRSETHGPRLDQGRVGGQRKDTVALHKELAFNDPSGLAVDVDTARTCLAVVTVDRATTRLTI